MLLMVPMDYYPQAERIDIAWYMWYKRVSYLHDGVSDSADPTAVFSDFNYLYSACSEGRCDRRVARRPPTT